MKRTRIVLAAILASSTSSIAAAQASGDTAAPASQPAAPEVTESNGGLEDIVVTAQRRAQNLQSVPIAITAISGDNAVAKGITNTQDLMQISPGLMVQTQAASVQMYMRGVGTDAASAGTEARRSSRRFMSRVFLCWSD